MLPPELRDNAAQLGGSCARMRQAHGGSVLVSKSSFYSGAGAWRSASARCRLPGRVRSMTRTPVHCTWPPRLALDLEITPRTEGNRCTFVVGSPSVGRYLMLGPAERRVLELLDGTRAGAAICEQLIPAPSVETLNRFL